MVTKCSCLNFNASAGGDGLFEHVGGGAGRAQACEAHRQPHTGDTVQEGSSTGHFQQYNNGCKLSPFSNTFRILENVSTFCLELFLIFSILLVGTFSRVSRLLFAVSSIHR